LNLAVVASGSDRDRLVGRRELVRVGEEVPEDLKDPNRVDQHAFRPHPLRYGDVQPPVDGSDPADIFDEGANGSLAPGEHEVGLMDHSGDILREVHELATL
jgi:hypothetical protein